MNNTIRKRLLYSIALVSCLFLGVHFLVFHSYYSVTTHSNSDDQNINLYYIDTHSGEQKPAISLFNLVMIPRNSDVLVATSKEYETRTFIADKPLIGVGSLSIELSKQRQLSKLGRDGLGCSGISGTGRPFSYDCYGSTDTVFTYANKKSDVYQNQALNLTLPSNRSVTYPYNQGLLALTRSDDVMAIDYYNPDRQDIVQERLDYYTVSDSLNLYTEGSFGESFMLVNNTKHEVNFYDSITSNRKVLKFSQDLIYTTCAVHNSTFSCVAKKVEEETTESASEDEHDTHSNEDLLVTDARLVSFDTVSNDQYSFKTPILLKTICLTSTGIYALDSKDILYFTPENSEKISVIANDTPLFSCGQKSFYSDGKALYETTSGNSRLVTKSNTLNITSIFTNQDTVIIDTVQSSDQQTAHTYELTSKPKSDWSPEDVLPYPEDGSLPIFEMDYDNTAIYIKPQVSVTSDSISGQTIVDENALAKTKRTIENKLRSDGVIGKYKLVYYFN